MRFDINNVPSIFGSNVRKAVPVSLAELKDAGIAFVSYGLENGDEVEFPKDASQLEIREQPIRVGQSPLQYLILVLKNGKMDWVSLGSMCRVGLDKKNPSKFSQDLYDLQNHKARVESLFGRKIKVGAPNSIEVQEFDKEGKIVQGGKVSANVANITEVK